MAVRKPTPGFVKQFVDPQIADVVVPQAAIAAVTAFTLDIPITLPRILLTALDTPADVVTDYIPGIAGTIVRWDLIAEVVATSGSTADADLDLQIGAVAVTGAKFTALTEADFSAIGKVKQSAALSAANTITATSTVSIVCTESATNFTAGFITPIIWVRVSATAALEAKVDAILTMLATAGIISA